MALSLDNLRTCFELNLKKANSSEFSEVQRKEFFSQGKRWFFQLAESVKKDFENIPDSTLKELESIDESIQNHIKELEEVKSELQATQKFFDAAANLIGILEIVVSKVPPIYLPLS